MDAADREEASAEAGPADVAGALAKLREKRAELQAQAGKPWPRRGSARGSRAKRRRG